MKALLPIAVLVMALAAVRPAPAERYVFAPLPDTTAPVPSDPVPAPIQVQPPAQPQVEVPTHLPALTNHVALDELIKNLPPPANPPPILSALPANPHAELTNAAPQVIEEPPAPSHPVVPAPVKSSPPPPVRPEPAPAAPVAQTPKPKQAQFVFAPLPTNPAPRNISYDLLAPPPPAVRPAPAPAPVAVAPTPSPVIAPPVVKTNPPAVAAPAPAGPKPPTAAQLFALREEQAFRESHRFAPLPTLSDMHRDLTVQYDAVKDPVPPPAPAKPEKKSPAANPAKARLIVAPSQELDGTVMAVDARGRFAVLNFPLGRMPAVDAVLMVFRHGVKVGEVRVTGPQRDDNTTADVLSGELQVDDAVRN
jgi:hypothetical protein